MDLRSYLESKAALVNNCLEELLPKAQGAEKVLYEAMRYSVFAGGKRLRPALFITTMELLNQQNRQESQIDINHFLPFACALEMIHTYSLIHDDLPSMDDDDYRRGKPTCHKVFGEAQAILAGDALLTYAFNAMLQVAPYANPERLLRAVNEVAWLAGVGGMIVGQVLDMEWEGQNLDIRCLDYIHDNKTGALFIASIVSAAILAGANEDEIKALRQYGREIGLAFQIADDILDVTGDPEMMGKPTGSDLKNIKCTYPLVFGLQEAKRMGQVAVEKAQKSLKIFTQGTDILAQIPVYFMERKA